MADPNRITQRENQGRKVPRKRTTPTAQSGVNPITWSTAERKHSSPTTAAARRANGKLSPLQKKSITKGKVRGGNPEAKSAKNPSAPKKVLGMKELKVKVVHAASQGCRRSMEDESFSSGEFFLKGKERPGPWSFHAVFDGHGGSGCSTHLKAHLYKELFRELKTCNMVEEALRRSFRKVDRKLCMQREFSGSTAITCLIHHPTREIWVANVGDSRAVASSEGKAIALSKDHKPNRPDEMARIKRAGGVVFCGRVNGELAVSRAFGDCRLKKDQVVTASPEITFRKAMLKDEFIVLGCDGLYDVMNNSEVVGWVHFIQGAGKGLQEVADSLVERAITELGSTDNVSVCVISFQQDAKST
uniref:PPM-type phosphatase domain-containing protein n=1 Tax=Lotharella globosa TaxID=91324 RepID=A0A7S3YG85_9EUKA|mmetsp:Transcript_21399/g.42926  ORF Transcript_21399/g.42926 Transcript_21399/m.42926 type:complete len:359 (+) Transcript_21399:177-1253(+)